MADVCIDTGWLIRFADPSKEHHQVAVDYFRYCYTNGHTMHLSTVVISEFEVRQDSATLPLQYFKLMPFNYDHAVLSAQFQQFILDQPALDEPRVVVRNDIAILAQAQVQGCQTILTHDGSTMAKWATRLMDAGLSKVYPILLRDGFHPQRLTDPSQTILI